MLVERVVTCLQRQWSGPPVQVMVRGRQYRLGGHGEPVAEVSIHRPARLGRLCLWPSLVFGEAYMRGDIEVRGSLIGLLEGFYGTSPRLAPGWYSRIIEWYRGLPRKTSRRQAVAYARHHYDIGNEFYKLWLDPSLTYSCACFLRDTDDLATAQQQKLELLCRKARLRPGLSLLDIGCGWGSLLFHAARHYGVHMTGVTPSEQQADYIEARVQQQGLGDCVRIIRADWRDVRGRYDRIVSVGMFEHVGLEQYPAFFRRWIELLADDGLSILHTIGRLKPQRGDSWIGRYVFPGGYLPSLSQIVTYASGVSLSILDVENLRRHYAKTLSHWSCNFQAVRDRVVRRYDEAFARMWWLYLQGAEAAFRWGGLQLWQIVLAKGDVAPWPLDREVNLADFKGRHTPITT